MKKQIIASLLALALAVPVCAADAPTLELEEQKQFVITTSVANNDSDIDLAPIYDGKSDTYVTVKNDGSAVFSVYTATAVPEPLSAFAAMIKAEKGTVIKVSVHATDDSLLAEWRTLDILQENELRDGYYVFNVLGRHRSYSFYRFDFELMYGEEFSLAEFDVFEDITIDPEFRYVFEGDEIIAGETPELVAIPKADSHKDNFEHGLSYSRRLLGK